jgi:crossover junction endodeoxyribonuclease RuvC
MSRFVLGLDPGTHFAGYALIDVRRPGLYRAQAMGTIVMRDGPLHLRLAQVMGELIPILEQAREKNAECVVERPFVNKNHMATLAISGCRAICLALIGGAELRFTEYSPQTWKRITGKGNAHKIEVANVVKRILELDFDPPLDAADAAGMAIYHAHTS